MNYCSLNSLSARDYIINVHVFCLIQVMIYCLYGIFSCRKTDIVTHIIDVVLFKSEAKILYCICVIRCEESRISYIVLLFAFIRGEECIISYTAFVLSEAKKAEYPILHFLFFDQGRRRQNIPYSVFKIRGEESRISYIALFVC